MAVTRDVALDAVRDLLVRPKRASIAFLDGDTVALVPVVLRFAGDRPLVRLPARGADLSGREPSELRNASRWGLRRRYYAEVKGGAGHLRFEILEAELLRVESREAGLPAGT